MSVATSVSEIVRLVRMRNLQTVEAAPKTWILRRLPIQSPQMLRRIYIHQLPEWPDFQVRGDHLFERLSELRFRQGRLIGRMGDLGFDFRQEVVLDSVTEDVVSSSEIEGELLNQSLVRSSVARRLGMDIGGLSHRDRSVEGIVDLILDATQNYDRSLTPERLFTWHRNLFPDGRSNMRDITIGNWRQDRQGPMQVVSGPVGRERVHFEAPSADRIEREMQAFLDWFNSPPQGDGVIGAAITHLWFITIHPFEDGNGRIARAITDMALARSEQTNQRFYSMSSQILRERAEYYTILERTQRANLDVSDWVLWFVECLGRSLQHAEGTLGKVMDKARFWERVADFPINSRQRLMINRLLAGFTGNLTTARWAQIAKCSQDTALRDIQVLINAGVLTRNPAGGRSTSYRLTDSGSGM